MKKNGQTKKNGLEQKEKMTVAGLMTVIQTPGPTVQIQNLMKLTLKQMIKVIGTKTIVEIGFRVKQLKKQLMRENGTTIRHQINGFKKLLQKVLQKKEKESGIKIQRQENGFKVKLPQQKLMIRENGIKIQKLENGYRACQKQRLTVKVVIGPKTIKEHGLTKQIS